MYSKIKWMFFVFMISFFGSVYGSCSVKSRSLKNILRCLFCCLCFEKKKDNYVWPDPKKQVAPSQDSLKDSEKSPEQLELERYFDSEIKYSEDV